MSARPPPRGWLSADVPLPDDGQLATVFGHKPGLPASCLSSLEAWREQIAQWRAAGVTGTRIHRVLVERHGYAGSYSSVYRVLCQIEARHPPQVPMRLDFQPGEAAQVDFGAGPAITDVSRVLITL